MGVTRTEYYFQLFDTRTKRPIDDDTGQYIVMDAGTPNPATIYAAKEDTSNVTYDPAQATNTLVNGVGQFWTDASVTSVDLTVVTANGESVYIRGLTPSQHRIDVNQEEIRQLMVAPRYSSLPASQVSGGAVLTATGSVWGNGLSIPAITITHDVFHRGTTISTLGSLNIGVSGTPSGFAIGLSSTVTGFHLIEDNITMATISNIPGLLFTGTNATNTSYRTPFMTPTATGVVWAEFTVTVSVSAGGYIYIVYDNVNTV